MANRLKTLLFVLLMTFSVYAAAPADGGMNERVCPMKCCKKMKVDRQKTSDSKYLCRVLMCSQTIPTNPPAFSASTLAPELNESISGDVFPASFIVSHIRSIRPAVFHERVSAGTRPIFIQISSFLI
jgi:hypothetical protein